ncbi:archease [Actinomadura algeriensis]|uniref:SHS2 domain-containing protein n=1 Tax=Actinomadura algeriensis TaxID=1679523 RepID=A0ABR9K2Q1_9ACTN|nr:archease [Actinomadura algeriensis]MBE1536610.1 SHS2 domain-containing protein [Actinomadura algeriensis]
MARSGPSGRGHRGVPHTADLRIEAWAPSREACIAEAVAGLVDGFADVSAVRRLRTVELDVPPGPDEDLLVSVLDEVIFRLEVEGEIVLGSGFVPAGGGLTARLTVGDVVEATAVGAVPKAVSLHGLRFGPDTGIGGWSCAVTIDV